MNTNNKSSRGKFITVEGIEGVGKSTSVKYIKNYLEQLNVPHIATREPGGTPIAEDIRKVILNHHSEIMSMDTELLLLFAGRAQHIATVIEPTLQSGKWVICDRFTDASYAYQGGGRGIASERIAGLEDWVQCGLQPDITILLHAPVEVALRRIKNRSLDRIEQEQEEFFLKVQNEYLARAKQAPERFRLIDSNQPLAKVQKDLSEVIDEYVR